MDAPLALYRRYRPETFAEVIGQEHVTDPLRQALAANRVNHAYLFSGPRGCGKTTSARILARALNCEQAPVADPCGECQSCRDLARGGPGSIDVIEIDAASHGGVDDARDLRERAFFAPASSRYKVYIIDEAHMVTSAGFNALLKLVEEPPPHVKFIFATTEPDKVIGTIRSRTHHYPFRLVPPKTLSAYLEQLGASEQVTIEPAALPLVVRAGGGSVRDTLSVLDQLLGGAGPEGVTYSLATSLLGFTPDALLDEVIDAVAAADGAAVFGAIDKVIESGQDPRRFAEDLLQRLRDLVVAKAAPEAVQAGILDLPVDRVGRITDQAARFGPSELVRIADLVDAALLEFRGATAPRLLLELLAARILVPAPDHTVQGFAARLDRIERRLDAAGSAPAPAAPAASLPSAVVGSAAPTPEPEPTVGETPAPRPEPEPEPVPEPVPVPVPVPVRAPEPARPPEPAPSPDPRPQPAPASAAAPAPGALSVVDVRRLWPEVLEVVKSRRFAWILISQNAQVAGLDGDSLTLAMVNAGARDSFVNNRFDEVLREALHQVIGVSWKIEAIVDPSLGQAPATPAVARPDSAPAAPRPDAKAPDSVRQAMTAPAPTPEDLDAEAHVDDPVIVEPEIGPEELLTRELGAQVIDEFDSGR